MPTYNDIFAPNTASIPSYTAPSLPASVISLWNPTSLATIDTVIADEVGTKDLTFGTVKPTLETAGDGKKALVFTSLTDQVRNEDFFPGLSDNWCMIAVISEWEDVPNYFFGNGSSRSLRYNGHQNFQAFKLSSSTTSTPGQPTDKTKRCLIVGYTLDAVTTIKYFSLENQWHNYLRRAVGSATNADTGYRATSSAFAMNNTTQAFKFWGGMYLNNPSIADIESATGWAFNEWLLPTEGPVFVYDGDSLTEVGVVERQPGWNKVLHDTLTVHGLQYGQGGERAIGSSGVSDPVWGEIIEAVRFVKNSGRVPYFFYMMGTNDIGADAASSASVITASEDWASAIAAEGGVPVYLQCCLDHQGGGDRKTVSTTIRDAVKAGTSNFLGVIDALENDAVWDWDANVDVANPSLMDDATHPNTAGNADIATKWLPWFEAIQNGPPTGPTDLDADPVTAGTPGISSTSITATTSLTADPVVAGTPILDATSITSTTSLSADPVVAGTPVVDATSITSTTSLVADAVLAGTPVIDATDLTTEISIDSLTVTSPSSLAIRITGTTSGNRIQYVIQTAPGSEPAVDATPTGFEDVTPNSPFQIDITGLTAGSKRVWARAVRTGG